MGGQSTILLSLFCQTLSICMYQMLPDKELLFFPVHMCTQEKLSTTQCKYFKKDLKTNVKLCNNFLTHEDLNVCNEADAYC